MQIQISLTILKHPLTAQIIYSITGLACRHADQVYKHKTNLMINYKIFIAHSQFLGFRELRCLELREGKAPGLEPPDACLSGMILIALGPIP